MSRITLDEMGPLLSREASARRTTLLGIFVAVSLAFLVLAFFWNGKYLSRVQLRVDEGRIVGPLAGTDVARGPDRADVAREVLFGDEILDRVVEEIGRVPPGTGNAARERAKLDIVANTEIRAVSNRVVEIAYTHSDPKVAFRTTTLFADLLSAATTRASAAERTEAVAARPIVPGGRSRGGDDARPVHRRLGSDLERAAERARPSASPGAERRGGAYRIARPANFPYLPTGPRFTHIAAGGIVVASVLPFLWLLTLLKLDPRIRTGSAITDGLELPLLATVPHMRRANERRGLFARPAAIVATVATVCALYVVVFIVKHSLGRAGAGGVS